MEAAAAAPMKKGAPICPSTPLQNDYLGLVCGLLRRELENPETQQKTLQPLMRWFFRHIVPYVLAIVLVNFFMTVAAVSLVLYFRGR